MPSRKAAALRGADAHVKAVGIWIRVSTEDQAKGESPEHHEKRARYYAESKGWRVVEVYNLAGVSGKAVLEHSEAKRMLADLERGNITGLIFSKLARLARNTRELLDIADIFRDHEADLVSLGEAIDTSSPAGRLFFTMIAAMAQFEREEIASRVAASVPIRAKLGRPLGGAAPFGYRWENRQLVPDPIEAPIRRLIHELFLEHRRIKTVARLLNDGGHRMRSGAKFTDTTVRRLLTDPTAKGVRRANYTRTLGDKKPWVLKPQDEWVLSEVEAIVPEDLWTRCSEILDERHRHRKRPAKRAVQLFAGVTYCVCGQKMYVPSNTPKYVCGQCRNKIPVSDLEAVFQEQLKAFVLSPAEIGQYLSTADQAIREKEELLCAQEAEQKKIQRDMDRVMQLYLDERISAEGFDHRYRPLEQRLQQLKDAIPELEGEVDFLKIRYLSSDEVLREAKDLYGRWGELDRQEKRHIVENVTDKITVGTDDVTIDLCYLPSSVDMAKGQRDRTAAL